MYSKLIQMILLSLFFVSSISCTGKIGEEPPAQPAQDIGGTECLSSAAASVKKFVEGAATNEELEAGWDCLGVAFYKFQQYVRGQQPGVYTPQELATFLEENFFEKNASGEPISRLPVGLLGQFMKIKQIFLGGSAEFVTRDEVLRSIEVFKELRKVTSLINPHMKILLMMWNPPEETMRDSGLATFEKANADFQSAARVLANLIQVTPVTYQMDDFANFIEELSKFYGEQWEMPGNIRSFMPVVKKLKVALAGGDEGVIRNSEWRTIILLGARGWVQYLRYFYFIETPAQSGKGIRLAYLARSFEDSFSIFEDLVREKPGGYISINEVSEIFENLNNVWPAFKSSRALVYEFMKVKVLLIGGSVDSFTNSDFQNARLKVNQFRLILEKFLPYVIIYGGDWDYSDMSPEEAQDYFMEAQYSLEISVRELGSLLEGNYDLADFEKLIHEWELLYVPVNPEQSFGKKLQKFLPLIRQVKDAIYDTDDTLVRKEIWTTFLAISSRLYTDWLYFHYFIEGKDMGNLGVLKSVQVFADQSFNILRDILTVKKSSLLSEASIVKLVLELRRIGAIPPEVKPQTIEEIVGVLLNWMLNPPERRIAGDMPHGLGFSSIEYARAEVNSWIDGEVVFSKAFAQVDPKLGISQAGVSAAVALELQQSPSENFKQTLVELQGVFNSKIPLTTDDLGHLFISSDARNSLYTRAALGRVNRSRMISRILLKSFVRDMDRINNMSGIKEVEAQSAYLQVKNLFVDIGMLEPTDDNFIRNRFLEANLFTPFSNGDQLSSFSETTVLVHLIFSGKINDSELKPALITECLPHVKEPKITDRVTYTCLRQHYRKSLPKNLPGLPGMTKYLRDQSEATFKGFFYKTLRASGWVPDTSSESKMTVKLSDVGLYSHLLQYMEMLLANYDLDADQAIGTDEALKAFPSFKLLFKSVAAKELADGTLKESELPALFTYILKNGRAPEGIWEGLTQFKPWVAAGPSGWVVWANRTKLASVLGYIAIKVSENP